MRYVGLDLHKHTLAVCVVDERGKVVLRESVPVRRADLEAFAKAKLESTDKVAVEATTNTWAVADILRPFVAAVVVGNPLQIRAIAQAKVKTDKIDAQVLAHLLRCDFLPEVWQPDEATRRLRQLTTLRSAVVADRTRLKNRVQSLLAQLLVVPPVKVLFSKAGLEWLRAAELPADVRSTIDLYLRLYDGVDAELRRIDDQLMALAYEDPRAKLLMTLPGVAHGVAVSLVAALGDISRFPDGDHAASYLGLTPRTRQSGAKCYHGGITKAGCPQTRAMLAQAVQAASDHPGPIGAFFRRLRKRKRHNVAVIATARKLVTVAYLMLKHNEPYRYAKPDVVRGKLADCRRKAGKAPAGAKKGTPPAAEASRLNDLYREHGLPACQPPAGWSEAERRGHGDPAVTAFAEGVHEPPAATPRRKRTAAATGTKPKAK
jgi:transposase